jgi:hypothetical protein
MVPIHYRNPEHIVMALFSQLEVFMENFEAKLKENGKDDDFIHTTYLGTLRGWLYDDFSLLHQNSHGSFAIG